MITYELILDDNGRKFFCSLFNHAKLNPIDIGECYFCGCEICSRCSIDGVSCCQCEERGLPMQQSRNRRIDKVMPMNHAYDHEVSECASSCKIMFKKAERVRAKQELARAVEEAREAYND